MRTPLKVSRNFFPRRAGLAVGMVACLASAGIAWGQSTFASLVGTVRDPSGAVVAAGVVSIENTGTSARRSTTTDQGGAYSVPNLEPGSYKVTMEAPGFRPAVYSVELLARQSVRVDGQVTLASQVETVNVTAEAAAVINTEVSNIAETKTGRELVDLPIAVTSRSGGSTSPISTLTTQPGVQTDASGNISVVGTKPSMLSISIDGISSMGPRSSGPLAELFPSFNSIAEIRVSQVNNTAEFGGVSDITTISKSGNNAYHGGVFENLQNTVMNARNPFSATVPKTIMNDFGFFLGGPVEIPKLYSGRDKTFFFMGYEGLRLARESVLVQSVPSLALRSGDLSAIAATFKDPTTGGPFPNKQIQISRISPLSLNILKYLYALPNTGAPGAIANNYVNNFTTPTISDQGDMRIDQNLGSRQNVFARFTYKERSVITAPTTGTPLLGPFSKPDINYGLAVAHNFIISPTLINEVRVGFSGTTSSTSFGVTADQITANLGLTGLPKPYPSGNAVPNFQISGFQSTGGTASTYSRQSTKQVLDNVTWTRGKHTLKFGGDYRYMLGLATNVYANLRLGQYVFDNSVTRNIVGAPYAAFLLGIPDSTRLNTVVQPDSDGWAQSYAVYGQDDWKVSSRLTINYGLRWEYHPMFNDHLGNATNFLNDYSSIINGKRVNGAIVVPNTAALKILNADFAAATAPTPIITAAQAGIPESLRFSGKKDFAPRVGFAWRVGGKTVIRGGYGRFIQGPLGSLLGAGYAIHSANQSIYSNEIVNGLPKLTFPYPFPSTLAQPGTQFFQQSVEPHFKDPTVNQWSLTFERDLGYGTGVRFSYNGSHASDLNIQGNPDQLAPNTIGFTSGSPLLLYPAFGYIKIQTNGGRANYHSLTSVLNKRLSKGVQFQSSYTYLRNLTNAQGYNPSAFAGESGGTVTDLKNLDLDYGNVAYSRRQRFLTTFLYQLPFGRRGLLFKGANGVVDQIIGGWEVAGVAMFQTGPFLTVTVSGADPSGTGFPILIGNGRADNVSGVSPYSENPTAQRWLNPAAYAIPGCPASAPTCSAPAVIGRFPYSPVGGISGPGTEAVSLSLTKNVTLREGLRLQLGGQASNLFNHVNYAPPNTTFNTSAFGTISNVQAADGAGPRQMQITARFTF